MVTSCAPCNLRKADRLPHEVGMLPRTRPRPPAPLVFITLAAPEVHPAWELYLGPSGHRLKTAAADAPTRARPDDLRGSNAIGRGDPVRR